jgi:serine protease Do
MNKQTFQVRRSVAMLFLAAALIVGGGLSWVVTSGAHPVFSAAPGVTLKVASAESNAPQGALSANGFAAVLQPLLPAVVNIASSKLVKTPNGAFQFPFQNDPLFRQFFGNPNDQSPREQREHSLGSGVIVSPDGYILTNNHVVAGATDIEVSLKDKRQFKAKVVGTDKYTDIAVLKIPVTGLDPVTFGNSTGLRVGDIVLAIGDPFGIGETVTMGIVSAKGRSGLDIEGPEGYEDFIQTDAAINPGNSGGALVNTRGQLVGINTAIIASGGGGNQGIGFAIPINMVRHVMEEILKTGKVTRGYLGVMIQEVTPDLAKAFNLPSANGALIGEVTPDSPAFKAGLEKGDVVVAMNGQPVSDFHDLRLRVSQTPPGQMVKLEVIRSGQNHEITVMLGTFPEKEQAAAAPSQSGTNVLQGVQVSALTPEIAQQLNIPTGTRGVVISQVDPSSAAADAGLQRGDVIQEVNRKPVSNVEQFEAAVRAASGQPVLLLVNRGGTTSYVVISSGQ